MRLVAGLMTILVMDLLKCRFTSSENRKMLRRTAVFLVSVKSHSLLCLVVSHKSKATRGESSSTLLPEVEALQ